jgi:RNA polymerase sigma-70 factor (ECF subfamily)
LRVAGAGGLPWRTVPIDANAFAARYQEYLPRVLNFIRLRVPDEGVAQDLAAQTFEQAFRKIDQLRNTEAFGGWLFRIARNEVGQYYRRRRPQASLDSLLDLPARSESPEEAAARREQLAAMLEAIAQLSDREQEIIALKFVAGLSNRDIAQAMGLSDSNVGVILFRAIRKVRDRLGIEA